MNPTMPAKTLLLTNACVIATMDDQGREITDGALLVRGDVIEAIGPRSALPPTADDVIDCRGQVLLPGMVNTHHHFFQTLTRALPAGQDAALFEWLTAHYAVWRNITPEMVQVSTLTACAELILSGCTTAADHQYLYPRGATLDDSIAAAATIGIRFHAARGAR